MIRGNAINQDKLQLLSQRWKKLCTKPLFNSKLKPEIEPLIRPESNKGINQFKCLI